LAGGVQHPGEIAKRVSLVEPVRALDDGNRSAGERSRLNVLAMMSLTEGLKRSQACLPQRALSNVGFVGELCASPALVIPSEHAHSRPSIGATEKR
jgi:hypothetical protein